MKIKELKKQNGTAFVELGVLLPVLLLIFAMTIDLGRQYSRSTQLSAICYEGLRQMTQERGLEEGRYSESQAASTSKSLHLKVQEKLRQLIEMNRARIPLGVSIITEKSERNVKIELLTNYVPLMPLFGASVVVKASMVGPYLYSS